MTPTSSSWTGTSRHEAAAGGVYKTPRPWYSGINNNDNNEERTMQWIIVRGTTHEETTPVGEPYNDPEHAQDVLDTMTPEAGEHLWIEETF